MAKQIQIDERDLEGGTPEGVGGQHDFVISALEPGVVALDIFDAGNANTDDARIESLQAESIDEARLVTEDYAQQTGRQLFISRPKTCQYQYLSRHRLPRR